MATPKAAAIGASTMLRQSPTGSGGSGRIAERRASSCRATWRQGGNVPTLTRAPAPSPPPVFDESCLVLGDRTGPGCAEIRPTRFPGSSFTISCFQHMGDRRTQEDRFTVVPQLEPDSRCPCAFFGVFDGTVGDFASDNIKDLVVPKLLESPNWRAFRQSSINRAAEQERLLENAVRDMYRGADEALLARCSHSTQHYATCTGVTCMVVGDTIVVGHLGDSRIVLGKDSDRGGAIVGEQLTMDHKPDLDMERQRIESSGGMVERLQNHSYKPFIRGGDFMMRKALGEQPMQLQYSRAFGGKDLKMFGLSNSPDVRMIRMGSGQYRHVRFIILASDGLWDVISTDTAVQVASLAAKDGRSPAETLVRLALQEQAKRRARADNVTALCIQFD